VKSSSNFNVTSSVLFCVYLIAVWDQVRISQFNWIYYDVTTYEYYNKETSFENSMLVQQTANLQLSSLVHVIQSLTQNARSIFGILASYQLENCGSSSYTGSLFA
jgi:origin recognition complex subunit 2